MKKSLGTLATLAALLVFSPAVAAAQTLYFNGAMNADWNQLANWWQDSGHTVQAVSLPGSADAVIVSAAVSSNAGPAPTVAMLALDGVDFVFGINATTTGGATFAGTTSLGPVGLGGNATFNGSSYNAGRISGDATFNDSSYNALNGGFETAIIDGDATFNGSSSNLGVVNGDATFSGSASGRGRIYGDATFLTASDGEVELSGFMTWGIIHGLALDALGDPITSFRFLGSSVNYGVATGTAYFADSAKNCPSGFITGTYICQVTGDATFTGSSQNRRTVSGNGRFVGSSVNRSTVAGDACFGVSASNIGTVQGAVTVCDETAPTLVSASVDGASLSLTYGESLGASAPAANTFTVTAGGAAVAVSSVSVSGSAVTLTLAAAVAHGETVTLSYAVPALNPIEDLEENAAAALSGQAVTNVTAAPADDERHSSSGRGRGGGGGSGSSSGTDSSGGATSGAPGQSSDPSRPEFSGASAAAARAEVQSASRRDLSSGSRGDDVRALQRFLNVEGFTVAPSGPGSFGQETDYFGPLTRGALARWQAAHGVYPAAGYFGPRTRGALAAPR